MFEAYSYLLYRLHIHIYNIKDVWIEYAVATQFYGLSEKAFSLVKWRNFGL